MGFWDGIHFGTEIIVGRKSLWDGNHSVGNQFGHLQRSGYPASLAAD